MRIVFAFCLLPLVVGCSPNDETADSRGRLTFEATQPAGLITQESEDEQAESSVPEFVETYNRRFMSRPPELGSTIPDLTVFSEDGREFELSATRGKYTVLVFGCLT